MKVKAVPSRQTGEPVLENREMISSRDFKRSNLTDFEHSLPGLIRARDIVTTELDRLVHDPITG